MISANATSVTYNERPIDLSEAGLEAVCALVNRASGNQALTPTYLRWQYLDNPAGPVVGYNAYTNGILVSHYAAIPVAAAVHGSPAKGLLSLNTATDPAHSGKGLFTRLANMTYETAKSSGFQYVIGVANDNSVYGFTQKLGFEALGELETRFVIGELAYRNRQPPPSLQPLWHGPSLEWRLSNPKALYYAVPNRVGALVYGTSNRFQVILHQSQEDAALSCVSPPPYRFRLNPLKMWLGLDTQIDWNQTLNFQVPSRLKATSLNLIFKNLQSYDSIDKSSLRFWALDFDSY